MTRLICIVILLSISCAVYAQNKINLNTNDVAFYYSAIVSKDSESIRDGVFKVLNSKKKIEWIQMDGEKKYLYDVIDMDYDWVDVKERGEKTFKIAIDNRKAGQLILVKDELGLTITLKLLTRSGFEMINTFKVHRFEII